MISRLYYRIGLFLGFSGVVIGILGFVMRLVIAGDSSLPVFINYSLCIAVGLLVMIVTLRSRRNPRMRYYSKQFQTSLLYLTGSLVIINSGDLAGVILFLLGVALANRYSYLASRMLLITAVYNCFILILYALLNDIKILRIVHELVFILFSYVTVYIIFADYTKFLKLKIGRLNRELDIARSIVPFGAELKKRIEASDIEEVEFTRKEYEVMVAICVHEKLSNDELSSFMNISVATVKSHLNNIFHKTGIRSRSRLIAVYKEVFVEK